MTFIDTYSIGVWTMVLVAPISYLIGAIAFVGFARTKSPMALLFSVSFFLQTIPSIDFSLRHFYNHALFDWVVIGTINIVAFILMVFAYFFEIGKRSKGLGRLQSWVVVLSLALSLAFAAYQFLSWPYYTYFGIGPLTTFVQYDLSIGLIVILVTLMVSLFREKGNRLTLIGMAGLVLILSGWAIIGAFLGLGELTFFLTVTEGWADPILEITGLMGYLIFLIAMLGARAMKV